MKRVNLINCVKEKWVHSNKLSSSVSPYAIRRKHTYEVEILSLQ
jgi:hypothetical protein